MNKLAIVVTTLLLSLAAFAQSTKTVTIGLNVGKAQSFTLPTTGDYTYKLKASAPVTVAFIPVSDFYSRTLTVADLPSFAPCYFADLYEAELSCPRESDNDQRILVVVDARRKIQGAIGIASLIARVGNSAEKYFMPNKVTITRVRVN